MKIEILLTEHKSRKLWIFEGRFRQIMDLKKKIPRDNSKKKVFSRQNVNKGLFFGIQDESIESLRPMNDSQTNINFH